MHKNSKNMPKNEAKKFLALYDLHFGWERGLVRGKWTDRLACNIRAIGATVKFIYDFQPDIVILGGDQLNCGPISHWHQGKPILDETFRLKDEMDQLDGVILKLFDKVGRKIWLDGNHEAWINDFVASNPGVRGLVEPINYLKLEKRGWEYYSQGEVAKVGKLNFVHGDVVLSRGSSVNPARTLVNAYRRNVRAGHIHSYSAFTQKNAIDSQDWHSAIVIPSLSNVEPFWNKNRPANFVNGFLYGYVYPDGHFSDQVVLINNNEFTLGGKRYVG
jgi:hypothetical protein